MMKKLGDVVEHRMNQPRTPTYRSQYDSVARGLGWFSIGLGLAEILMPRAMARGLGMQGREQLLFVYGLREIATGIGLLASSRRTPWMWGRVAGDALDMATLAGHMRPGSASAPPLAWRRSPGLPHWTSQTPPRCPRATDAAPGPTSTTATAAGSRGRRPKCAVPPARRSRPRATCVRTSRRRPSHRPN
jgi:hypothetical protein